MANLANLQIGIGTELGGLRSGLAKAQKQITSFSEGVESRLGSISTGRLEKGLANIGTSAVPAANKLSTSLRKVQRPAQNTTMAVTNLNRVVQDAPFGILGIANNIEPLIQSFNSLKASTGSTTSALKTLVKSALTGPGALITAVSVASSLLIVFGNRLFGAGNKADEASDEIKDLAEAADQLNNVLKQDTGLADEIEREIENNERAIELAKERARIEEQINLQSISIGSGRTRSQQRQIEALEEQQDALDAYIARLGFEKTALSDLEKNLASLRRQQELYSGEVGTSTQRLSAYVDALEGSAQKAIDNYEAGITKSTDAIQEQRAQVINLLNSFRQLARNGNEDARRAAVVLNGVLEDLNNTLGETSDTVRQTGAPVVELSKFFPTLTTEVENTDDALKGLRVTLDDMPGKMDVGMDEIMPAPGSIALLEKQITGFRQMRALLSPTSAMYEHLTNAIARTEAELNKLTGATDKIKDKGLQNVNMLAAGFGRLAGQIIKGKKEALSFGNIMSAVLPGLINVLFPGGGAIGGLLGGIVGGIFHDGGVVPGPMGSEQLVLAQGGETIRTPAQERALSHGSGGTIHITGEFRQRGTDLVAVIDQTKSGTLR